jgi:hypothetical protein
MQVVALASAAPQLALRGLAIFPLAEGSKKPMRSTNSFYFASADADLARARWSKNGPGLDVRGSGGYAVAPPSRLSDGRRYSWIQGPVKILDAPDWLIAMALPPAHLKPPEPKPLDGDVDSYVASAISTEMRHLASAHEGIRNDTLNKAAFSIAGFAKAGYVPQNWAIAKLETIAVKIGLPLPEARATIRSAFIAARPREVKS